MKVLLAGAAVACAAAVVGACGGGAHVNRPAPSAGPGKVVQRYYTAARDPEARCATLAGPELAQFGSGGRCATVIRPSATAPPAVETKTTRVRGHKACVLFELSPGGEGIALLALHGAAWKIEEFDVADEGNKPGAAPCRPQKSEAERERERKGPEGGGTSTEPSD